MDITEKESIIEKADRYREEGKKYRKQFEPDWDEYERFYEGQHFKDKSPDKRPTNYTFQIIESEVPLLMDPMPATDVVIEDERYAEYTDVLNGLKDHIYREQNVAQKDVQSFRDLLKTGNGYQYIDYDPDGEKGEGSVTVKNLTWGQVVMDPAAEEIDQCRYVIIDVPISNDELKKRYPKTAKDALGQKIKDIYVFSGSKYNREDQNLGNNSGSSDTNRYESKDMSFLEECWLRDYSMEEIPDDQTQIELTEESAQLMEGVNPDIFKWEDHEKHISGHSDQEQILIQEAFALFAQANPDQAAMGLTPEILELIKQDPEVGIKLQIIADHKEMHQIYLDTMDADEIGKRPKYPNGWRLIIKTGKVVHFDDVPDVDDGMVPLVPFYCYKGQKIYADGAVKNLVPMQKTINELKEKELKGLKLVANPGWVVDSQSNVDPDTLTDEDGIVVVKEQGTEAQRLPPGQVSPQLERRIQLEYEAMQKIEGVGEVVFGEAPKTQSSGILYRRIQMQALGRIRLKSRMIENAVYRRDKLILSRAMKKYSTARKLMIEDHSGEIKFLKFDPRTLQNLKYEIVLAPGTSAGNDPETVAETYKEMLLAGAIDLKMYATLTNPPKKQALLAMLEEKDQIAAQMQEMQAALQQSQLANIELKAQLAPQMLTPEEIKIIEEQQQTQPVGMQADQGMAQQG
jgi:hypothetical protein